MIEKSKKINSEKTVSQFYIHQDRTIYEQEIRQGSDKHQDPWGGMMVCSLWYHQVNTIIDVKLGDADANTYKYEPMIPLLERWEKIKKDKHGKHCHDQRKRFLSFVLSVKGILGREALVILSQLSRFMSDKREEPPLQVWRWVNGRIAIAVARSYSRMICRDRLPSPLRER